MLVLLIGVTSSIGLSTWLTTCNQRVIPILVVRLIWILLLVVLAAASWSAQDYKSFQYQGHARCSGPWGNPNIFGLLMGAGTALAVGIGMRGWKMEDGGWKSGIKKYSVGILCFVAAVLMGRGLLHSYSRGAWLATFCGITYLLWQWINRETREIHKSNSLRNSRHEEAHSSKSEIGNAKSEIDRASSCRLLRSVEAFWFSRVSFISRLKRNWLPMFVVLASAFVLVFWHFRQTEWHPVRRALSALNAVDFSWRNRVAAWEGALQIAAEHPWFGAGWNQPEPLYEHYYLSPKLNESAAIEMNDYLMLGATLGIPALFCFGMYLWLSLTGKSESRKQKAEIGDSQDAGASLADSLSAPGGRGEGQGEVRAIQSAEIGSQDLKSDLRPPASDLLSITCRAGAIVLLVGFWFDGGLFKLPTAATFWILLELGSAGNREICEPREND
jgi:hypothetical protein